MTTSPVLLERKVRQLDNDVTSIYEMLSAIQGTQLRHGNRFDELDDKMTSLEGKVDRLQAKVEGLDERMGSVQAKVEGLDERLGSVQAKVDSLGDGMQSVLELLRAR